MANADRPMGLVPRMYLNGSPWNGQGRLYSIPTSDSTNAYAIGDPVKSNGSADAWGIAGVTLGTAGAATRGVIIAAGTNARGGPYINPNNLSTIVVPVTKLVPYYVLVVDDPNVIFEIQEVSGGTALTAAEVGLNANYVAGTNNGYISAFELNNSGEATTATLNCKILGLAQYADPSVNTYGEHAKWLVTLNEHELRAGTTGV